MSEQLFLRAYPPSFRRRYGGELAALVDDLPSRRGTTVDLLRGAAIAWLRPSFVDRKARLRATLATTWVAWCAAFLIVPATNRALLDPPMPGVTPTVRGWLAAAVVLFAVGWALALAGAAPVVLRGLLPAIRQRQWLALRPLAVPLLLGAVEAAGLLAIAVTHATRPAHPSSGALVGVGLWLAGFAAFVVSLGLAPAVSVGRVDAPADALRYSAAVAPLLAVATTAVTACSAVAVAQAGDAEILKSTAPVIVALVIAALASIVALVSASRGARVLLTTRRR